MITESAKGLGMEVTGKSVSELSRLSSSVCVCVYIFVSVISLLIMSKNYSVFQCAAC